MSATTAVKSKYYSHNGAYGHVCRGVQKMNTRVHRYEGTNFKSLQRINLDTATDPSVGSGGFLAVTLNELRKIEEKVNIRLGCSTIDTSPEQFYGIDIDPISVTLCKMTMFLINRVSEIRFAEESNELPYLDISNPVHVICDNALKTDWSKLCEGEDFSYIIGNPPFSLSLTNEQKKDRERLAVSNSVDYCGCWVVKAAKYMHNRNTETAFILTDSCVQGVQVAPLWQPIAKKYRTEINFAYQRFEWDNDLDRRVQAYCVIVGFASFSRAEKCIYSADYDCKSITGKKVDNINFYLSSEPNFFVLFGENKYPLTRPGIFMGKHKYDSATLEKHDGYVNYYTADAMLGRKIQYSSPDYAIGNHIIIPRHSSILRKYIPMIFVENAGVAVANSCLVIPDATELLFGLINNSMHQAWAELVTGKLYASIRYSGLAYYSFPFPEMTEENQRQICHYVRKILEARTLYDMSLGIMYEDMPPLLRLAHTQLDNYIEQLYASRILKNNVERTALLVNRYLSDK